ncbi:MAG: LacI family DNA-binding transcriptional regulator [Firmicutes bacterium]|nr:LacI family DNA-binding transcriptional regulator [Bacillota bacterium]
MKAKQTITGRIKRSVTLRDIARQVGVSPTTVSNVLNGRGRVSEQTARRVHQAVVENRFIINATARTLRQKQSKIVGVIIPIMEHLISFHDNPFYWAFVSGLQQTIASAGFHVMLDAVEYSSESVEIIRSRNLDGVVVVGSHESFPLTQQLAQIDTLPIIFVDSYLPTMNVNTVTTDDRFGSYLATRYLLGLGHRKIVFLSGPLYEHGVDHERWLGYVRALSEQDTACRPIAVETQMSLESGRLAAHRLIYEHPDVTAVVATGDVLAIGVLRGFFESGVRVPHQCSIIGFDDVSIASHTVPSLTTIHQDIKGKGEAVGRMLLRLIAGQGPPQSEHISLNPHLVVRESTAPPPTVLNRLPLKGGDGLQSKRQ